MQGDTREKLLDMAEKRFAERGFYGVSIAAIAEELGLTKQALLHHFGSKEKLYGAVLARISEDYRAQQVKMARQSDDPTTRLKAFLLHINRDALAANARTRLLMRELLDNNARAKAAGSWYLTDFLTTLTQMVQAIPAKAHLSDAEALALAYQFLGAINYFAISRPTLTGIFGAAAYDDMCAAFPAQLDALLDAGLGA